VFTVHNQHHSVPLMFMDEPDLLPGEARSFQREMVLYLGSDIVLRIEPEGEDSPADHSYRSLNSIPPTPGNPLLSVEMTSLRQFEPQHADTIVAMLRLALQVVQNASGSDAFYQAAAVATTEIVQVDRAMVLLRPGVLGTSPQGIASAGVGDLQCVASHTKTTMAASNLFAISRSLLSRVIRNGATVIHDPRKGVIATDDQSRGPASLVNVECAVASPILNQHREVIGVLYADRRSAGDLSPSSSINDMEATLIEILAGAVAGGIARCAEERFRHTLSEFFSPKVASRLATNPELMVGQDAEVSVLFCDIRGFSSVTQELGPEKAIDWVNDVMSELSECVLERDGVLVDYVGDELLAMWGAPGEQPTHAALAVDAARAMMRRIELLRERWQHVLPHQFGAGIGVNTGLARVGNVGSRQKFKYGPLGNTVNLGSRLQSATKQLGVNCVISHETAIAADCLPDCRRIANLQVVGIEGAVSVYEIVCESSDDWRELTTDYQLALVDYEAQKFRDSARRLGALLHKFPDDRLSQKLLARAVAELDEPNEHFTGVWSLTSK
jgi:class 3 adenylate cyclase